MADALLMLDVAETNLRPGPLGQALADNCGATRLETLNLAHNTLGEFGAVELLMGIRVSPVVDLDISGTGLSGADVAQLAGALVDAAGGGSTSRSFSFGSFGDGDDEPQVRLVANGIAFEDGSLARLGEVLSARGSRMISELSLADCTAGSADMRLLLEAIHDVVEGGSVALNLSRSIPATIDSTQTVFALTELVLSGLKELVLAGGPERRLGGLLFPLIRALGNDQAAITTLAISHNHVGDDGLMCLGESLGANTTLTSLRMDHNMATMKGLRAVSSGVLRNVSLIDLELPVGDLQSIMLSFDKSTGKSTDVLKSEMTQVCFA